jgi:hypothetical protein
MSQKGLGTTGLRFDPPVAAPGEWSVTGEMMTALSFGRIGKLFAGLKRPVERYRFKRHFLKTILWAIGDPATSIWR